MRCCSVWDGSLSEGGRGDNTLPRYGHAPHHNNNAPLDFPSKCRTCAEQQLYTPRSYSEWQIYCDRRKQILWYRVLVTLSARHDISHVSRAVPRLHNRIVPTSQISHSFLVSIEGVSLRHDTIVHLKCCSTHSRTWTCE